MTLPTITHERIDLSPGDELILRYRTWDDYETLLTQRSDRAGLRVRYNAAKQEIRVMAPLPQHGKHADVLADVVKALLRHQGKDWEAFTPITLKRDQQQGIEPDYCFYIQNRDRILGKERIDLNQDPPPDLAIEIDLTSITSPEDYQAIAPQELWIYRQHGLLIYQFEAEHYQECQGSLQFPEWNVKQLIPQYVNRGWHRGASVALREFEQFLQNP
jgi:Uma2 family endonuclease